MMSQKNKCPYCGIHTIGSYCVSCSNIPQILYDKLIRDLEELSANKDWREFWYFRAESLKTLDKKLYYRAMDAARIYNEEIRARDRRIKEEDLRCRMLAFRMNAMELEEMAIQRKEKDAEREIERKRGSTKRFI